MVGRAPQAGEGDLVASIAVAQFSHVVHSATPRGRRARGACRAHRARARAHAPGLRGERADDRRRQVAFVDGRALGQQRAEEPLARRADEHAVAERAELVEPAEQLPVVLGALREPETRGRARSSLGCDARGDELGDARSRARRAPRRRRRRTPERVHRRRRRASASRRRVTPVSATTRPIAASASPPETSLTISAPASTAARAVDRVHGVDADADAPARRARATTGMTRRCSSSGSTGVAPGRVDSPPTSTSAAPCVAQREPRARSRHPASHQRPPSLNESGVTFRMPMHAGSRHPAHGIAAPISGR